MKISIIAIGQKLPDWAENACSDYLRRFPKDWCVEVKALKAEDRAAKSVDKAMLLEASRIKAALPKDAFIVVLDEHGVELTSTELASKLLLWQDRAQSVAFIIGGADGLTSEIKKSADLMLRLSSFTLPHALARVLVLEQIYRCWSLVHNHPYHRA